MRAPELPIPESYWVIPGRFLAGEYPGQFESEKTRSRIDAFLAGGVNTFIDLTSPGEMPPYESILREQAQIYGMDIQFARFPIGDFGLPTRAEMKSVLNAVESALEAGRKVYVHCRAGIGRTGTTVGCYLVRRGQTGPQALRQIAEWWRNVPKSRRYTRSPETDEQVQFILGWEE